MRKIGLLGAVLALYGLAGAQTKAKSSTTTFRDSETGASFRYSADWTRQPDAYESVGPDYYVPVIFWSPRHERRVLITFDPNSYPKTDFTGLSFAYVGMKKGSAGECASASEDFVGSQSANVEPRTVSIGGVPFRSYATAGAGMCHQSFHQIYAGYHAGQCYVFETDFNTHCGPDGERPLTATERAGLMHELDRVMQSVRLDGR